MAMKGKGVAIGLTNLHYAEMLTDDAEAGTFSYGAPVRIAGAITANFSPNAANDTLFADDGPYESAYTLGAMTLELNIADLKPQHRAFLLGETYSNGIVSSSAESIPPYVAIGMSVKKSNGADRLIWYLKGKFSPPDENNQTKSDSINWNTPTITGNFLKRDADNLWRMAVDTDDPNVSAAVKANWFTSQSIALTGAGGTLITDIALDANTKALTVGTNGALSATVTPVTEGINVVWASSDESVVTVTGGTTNASGISAAVLVPVGAGTAIVSASVGSVRVLCSVTVSE